MARNFKSDSTFCKCNIKSFPKKRKCFLENNREQRRRKKRSLCRIEPRTIWTTAERSTCSARRIQNV